MSAGSQDQKIQQMINFIKSEANEKANEIQVQAREDFAVERQNLVEDAKKKIREEYNKKEQDVKTRKKIDHSNEIKSARLELLKYKEQALHEMMDKAGEKIREMTKDEKKYGSLMKNLVLQCAIRLREKKISVYCRKNDLNVLKNQVNNIKREYKDKTGEDIEVNVDDKRFLSDDVIGGVQVTTQNDSIRMNNTLSQRLHICQEQQLPVLREMLFPKKETQML